MLYVQNLGNLAQEKVRIVKLEVMKTKRKMQLEPQLEIVAIRIKIHLEVVKT